MRKFETHLRKWESEFYSKVQTESYQAFIARKARTLAQGRRWSWLRGEVWERDKGVCQVCGDDLTEQDRFYECGHIVDRAIGGKDELSNLLVMCILCNRLKPFHYTVEQFEEWRSAGGVWGQRERAVTRLLDEHFGHLDSR